MPYPKRAKRNVASTARVTTFMRALGHRLDGPEANDDHLAQHCLPSWVRLLLKTPPAARLVRAQAERHMPGGYGYFSARTRYVDEVVSEAASHGLQQLVLLGVGLDSRPQRFASALVGTRVFEVDMPMVLEVRRARLQRASLGAPNAIAVPIDFEYDSLEQVLERHGYRKDGGPTLFVWEGVTFYLPEEAVLETLRSIAAITQGGGGLVFDYVTRAFFEGDHSTHGARALALGWRRLGNVNRSSVTDVRSLVEPLGFRLRADVGASELEQRYLSALPGGPRRAFGPLRIAHVERAANAGSSSQHY